MARLHQYQGKALLRQFGIATPQGARTARLMKLAAEAGIVGEALAAAVETQMGRALPVNVDGAIGALLLDIGIPPELGNTFFMMARMPGLVAQVHEEMTRERPMRHIHPTDHDYDGPE